MYHLFEAKAKNGVKLIYNWASDANPVAPATAGGSQKPGELMAHNDLDHLIDEVSIKKTVRKSPQSAGNTLRLEDVLPAWSGPGDHPKS